MQKVMPFKRSSPEENMPAPSHSIWASASIWKAKASWAVSDTQNDVTASYYQDKKQLSTWTVTDDGDYLGTDPPNDKFDLLYIRLANDATIAEKIDFTNFKVEVTPIDSKQSAAK
jgi:hypothetical protein